MDSLANKSCELDSWPISILKSMLSKILPVIQWIFHLSLSTGQFVPIWKNGLVKSFIKTPGNHDKKNYRPVTNLPFLVKVLEKVAMDNIIPHIQNRLPAYQSAYRAHFSCETLLAKLHNDLLWSMEVQEMSQVVAMDMSTAFDTIDHGILKDILYRSFQIRGKVLDWLMSYRGCA